MNMQDVKNLAISEGDVRTIHDSSNNLLWGKLSYDTKYAGDTFQQTYSGKNLISLTPYYTGPNVYNRDVGYQFTSGTSANVTITSITDTTLSFDITAAYNGVLLVSNPVNVGETYYISASLTSNANIRGTYYTLDENYTVVRKLRYINESNTSYVLTRSDTVNSGEKYFAFSLTASNSASLTISNIQIEVGSTATDYEPYVGGVPSPNPDYPQDIDVVTGEQTVTVDDGVNSESFTVDLGSIELCKIGTYQDYIYKSGDDWYVHKETKKIILDGTEDNWDYSSIYSTFWLYNITDIITTSTREKFTYSNNFSQGLSTTAVTQWASMPNNSVAIRGGSTMVGFKTDIADSTTAWKTWLDLHNTILYYPLATPTDTKITDNTLIEQLDAVHEWLTRYGYTATVTGNLPIIIEQTNL